MHGQETHMSRLYKSLYRSKKASCTWHFRIGEHSLCLGFTKTYVDPNIFYLFDKFELLVLALYVDDLILIGN